MAVNRSEPILFFPQSGHFRPSYTGFVDADTSYVRFMLNRGYPCDEEVSFSRPDSEDSREMLVREQLPALPAKTSGNRFGAKDNHTAKE